MAWRVAARLNMVAAVILFFSGVIIETISEKKRSIVEHEGLEFKMIEAVLDSFGKTFSYSSQKLRVSSGMSILLYLGFW